MLEDALKSHADEPAAYVALAQIYVEDALARARRRSKLLQDAEVKFPADTSIAFELGAVFDKQKNFAGAETVFRQVLAREPDNAGALNYLGYMLAERGERLDESVGVLKKALTSRRPDNGSFLDSLGWAYFKAGKLDLAEENLRRAADQLKINSVIQEHYGRPALQASRRYEERHPPRGIARPVRRRRLDRPRRYRQKDPGRQAKTQQTMKPPGARGAEACPRAFVAVRALVGLLALMVLSSLTGRSSIDEAARPAPMPPRPMPSTCWRKPLPPATHSSADGGDHQRGPRGHRVRGRLSAGVAAPASVRLEAVAPFGPAGVHLRRDQQRRHAAAAPRRSRAGAWASRRGGAPPPPCAARCGGSPDNLDRLRSGGRRTGGPRAERRLARPDHVGGSVRYELYLHREGGAQPWRLVSTVHAGSTDLVWRAEYRDFQNGLPRSIRVTTVETNRSRETTFVFPPLSQVETNAPLRADAFLHLPPPPRRPDNR